MEQMLQNDPQLRSTLYTLGRKLQPYLNLAPLAEGNLDAATSKKELQSAMASQVWAYIKSLNDLDAKDLGEQQVRNIDKGLGKGSWQERRKSLNGSVIQQMGKGFRPENTSTLEAVGYAAMKRYLTEKTFEYMNRMWQKKNRTQNKNIKETPYEFIAELGDESLDNIFDIFDFDMPSEESQKDLSDAANVMSLAESEGESQIPEFASMQKAIMAIAPVALASKDAFRAKQMWDLLYNPNSDAYRGREGFYNLDKTGAPTSQKNWDRISELWKEAYGDSDKKMPSKATLENIHNIMQRRIYLAIQREAGREDARSDKSLLDQQSRTPEDVSDPALTPEPSNARPDVRTPGVNVKRDRERAKEKVQDRFGKRIAKIRALIKV
jgi:hypothetical protein